MVTNDGTIIQIKHDILCEVAKLVFAGKFETELTLMEKGKVYNVPKECWFYSITQKDTKMVYVQDSGCSMENSDFCDLSEEEIKKIQEEARHLFA